jgi:diguanylate cyclase (GGDEF)-like protein
VLEVLTKVIDVPACCLFVIDKHKAETLFSASVGMVDQAVPPPPAVGFSDVFEVGGSHFMCTSIVDHHQMMVVFCADAAETEAMSEEDQLVLQAVASELVVAVENSQLYKLTKRLAITDELTSLYNYRYLQQRLDEEIERAKRYHKDLSLLMLDVDDFKSFNDKHGHIAGDRALSDLGSVLKRSVREVDVVCRYGGEEFSVALPETDAAGAYVVAEKIREAVATYSFADAEGERDVHMTVSIGLATFPGHAEDKESLLRMSDDALYQAKSGGKDRVRSPVLRPDASPKRVLDDAEG